MIRVRSTRSLKRIKSWQELFVASVTIGSRWTDADGRVATVKAKSQTAVWFEICFDSTTAIVTLPSREFVDRFYQGKL